MKNWMVYFSAVLVLCISSSVTQARQADSATGLNAKGKKAYSLPVSNKRLHFRVTAPEGQLITIRVQEGAMGKILAFSKGYGYAFVPYVKGIDNNSSNVSIYRLTQDEKGNESIQEVEHLSLELNRRVATQVEPRFEIELLRIDDPSPQVSNVGPALKNRARKRSEIAFAAHDKIKFAAAGCVDCCVTCSDPEHGTYTACGDGVCASCGSCQDPGHPKMICD